MNVITLIQIQRIINVIWSILKIGRTGLRLEPDEVEAGSKYWLSIEPEGTQFDFMLNLECQIFSKTPSQQINQVSSV